MKKIPAKLYFACFAVFGAAILGMLFNLQILKGEFYGALALGQQTPFEESNSLRGSIFFSDGSTILAQTVAKPIISISPSKIPEDEKEKTIQELSAVLGDIVGEETIKKDLTAEQYKIFKQKNLKGTYVDEVFDRVSPNQKFASHLSGFVNNEGQGQYGVEGFYNDILCGKSLQLTIDYNIQYEAEKFLEEAANDWQMDSGQIIVQEPSTGKILAMAIWPEFNPNQYGQEKDLSIFSNPSIQALFEPGSVFKPLIMSAALEENLVAPETKFFDKGVADVGGPLIYNFAKKAWGEQTMVGVLENSINTGMVFVEQKLGKSAFLKYAQKFGLFEKTGIDLAGEIYSANETLKKGYPRDFAVASFGQGIQITSMQLLQAISAIANQGNMMKPYIVENKNPVFKKQVISQDTAFKISAMMVSVVENGGGRRAKVPGYLVAGKTGTAQIPKPTGGYYDDRTIQSFVGFAPATSPKFSILIRLDNPKQSDAASSCAAPIFGKLAKYILDLKQIPPTEVIK